jgi:porin
LFLNSSHGIGAEFGLSGVNGPSVFPTASLGMRLKVKPTPATYVQVAVLDGIPGDPDDPDGTHIILDREDGLLLAAELAYLSEQKPGVEVPTVRHIGRGIDDDDDGKLALGAWSYTASFDDLDEVDPAGNPLARTGSYGFYVLAEHVAYREADNGQGLRLFCRAGWADPEVNRFAYYTGIGGVYTGLVSGSSEDALGFAVAAAYPGADFKEASRNAGTPVNGAEVTLELTYQAPLTPWLTFQPDLQYVINPGLEPAVDNAVAFGARFAIVF